MSVVIAHRSEQELEKVLRESPQLINQTNGFANTPLHLAANWPYGIQALLKYGACPNATDQSYRTPLYYAICMGNSETVSLLVKADCDLEGLDPCEEWNRNVLEHAIQVCYGRRLSMP